jgi:cell wall-associated NlpC family hydrolase
MERADIVKVARSYVGTPYKHQGRSRKGIDCIGLVICVAQEFGVQLIAPNDYAPSPSSNLVLKHADTQGIIIPDKKIALGRIVVMWGMTSQEAQHFAVVGDMNGRFTMIHAFSKRGMVVEHSWDNFWIRRIMKVYELPGTAPLENA